MKIRFGDLGGKQSFHPQTKSIIYTGQIPDKYNCETETITLTGVQQSDRFEVTFVAPKPQRAADDFSFLIKNLLPTKPETEEIGTVAIYADTSHKPKPIFTFSKGGRAQVTAQQKDIMVKDAAELKIMFDLEMENHQQTAK